MPRILFIVWLWSFSTLSALGQSPCYNIDFETGTLNGWNTNGDVSITTSANVDPYGGFSQAIGNYSVMVSNDVCSSSLFGEISRDILITPDNSILRLHIALVIYNDEFHDSTDAAMFTLRFFDSLGNELQCPKFTAYYDGSIDSFIGFPDSVVNYTPTSTYYDCFGNGPNNISYIPWYSIWIDLSSYIGQTLTVVARVDWCAYGPDWAYAYLDFECVGTQYNMTAACDTLPQEVCGPPDMLWYEWYDSLNNLLSTNQCDTFNTKGIYTLKFAHPDYCTGNDIISQVVIPIGFAPPSFSINIDTVCFGDTTTLVALIDSSESPISEIIWDLGDGTIDTTLYPDSIITHYYNNVGPFEVLVVVSDTMGCVDSVYDTINLYKLFDANLIADSAICSYDSLRLIALTIDSFLSPSFTYVWDFGNGVIDTTFDSIASHYYNSAGNYIVIVHVYEGNCMDIDSQLVLVVPPPHVNAITTAPVCEDSSFTLIAQGAPSYEWLFPDSTTSTDSIITITPASIRDTGLYIIKAINAFGCISYDSIRVVVWRKPWFHINTDTVCLGDTTTLIVIMDSVFQGISQYIWNTGDAISYVNNFPDSIFLHKYSLNGSFFTSVTVIDSMGCRNTIYDTIYVHLPFNSEIITDPTYCFNDTTLFTAITYDTISNPSFLFIWHTGDGNVDTTFDSTTTHVYLDTGTYVVELLIAHDNCFSRAVDTIIVYPIPHTTAFTSPVCEDSTLILKGSGADYYTWFFNGSPISNDSTVVLEPASLNHSGKYILKGTNVYGCITIDTVEAVIWQRPMVNVLDTSICRQDTIIIDNHVTGGTPPYSFYWTPNQYISCLECKEPFVYPQITTNYIIKVVDSNECYRYDTATIEVFPLPVIDIKNEAFCYYDTLTVDASRPDLVKWLWTPSSIVSCDTCSIINIAYLQGAQTTYNLTLWVQDTNTCQWTDSFYIFIDTGIAFQLLQDTIVYVGEEVTLYVTAHAWNYNYYWETSLPPLHLSQSEALFKPVETDTYQVVYISETYVGCLRYDTVFIVAIEPPECTPDLVFVPNAFTPNADGINDVLYVYSVAPVTVNVWRIYDQWGNLLFESKNQTLGLPSLRSQDGWDGTYNGKKLPPDVYVYYLQYTCGQRKYFLKGDVSIIY